MLRVIILTVLVLAVLGGALWLAYSAGRQSESRADGGLPPREGTDGLPRIDTPPPPLPRDDRWVAGEDASPEDQR